MGRPRNIELLREITILRGELHFSYRKILAFFKKSRKPVYKTVATLGGVKSLIWRAKKYGYKILN